MGSRQQEQERERERERELKLKLRSWEAQREDIASSGRRAAEGSGLAPALARERRGMVGGATGASYKGVVHAPHASRGGSRGLGC